MSGKMREKCRVESADPGPEIASAHHGHNLFPSKEEICPSNLTPTVLGKPGWERFRDEPMWENCKKSFHQLNNIFSQIFRTHTPYD